MSTTADPRIQYGPVAEQGGILARDLRQGDRILAPLKHGTTNEVRIVVRVDYAGRDEVEISFASGEPMISGVDEIWPVVTGVSFERGDDWISTTDPWDNQAFANVVTLKRLPNGDVDLTILVGAMLGSEDEPPVEGFAQLVIPAAAWTVLSGFGR